MKDLYSQLISYLPAMWRRRWQILGIAWLVCLAGWAAVAFVPDRYESSARVHVDTESLLQPLLRGLAVDVDALQRVEMMHRTLLSRPNLEKVARMADLDLNVHTDSAMQRLIAELREDIRVEAQRNNLFTISYAHAEPETAHRVVQALLNIFVESNLGDAREDLDNARAFLDDQTRVYRERAERAQEALSAYKQDNLDYLPGNSTFVDFLSQKEAQLSALKAQLADAQARANELKHQLEGVPKWVRSDGGMLGEGPPSGLQTRILAMEGALDELLLRYTNKHPDVIQARTRIAELRGQLAREQEAMAGPPSGNDATDAAPPGAPALPAPPPLEEATAEDGATPAAEPGTQMASLPTEPDAASDGTAPADGAPATEAEAPLGERGSDVDVTALDRSGPPEPNMMPNDLYREIRLQIVSAETEVATLASSASRLQEEVADLRAQAGKVPAVEAQLRSLQREFQMAQEQYERLLARQESAAISESRETRAEKVQFRVIDPPRVPAVPSGIERSLLLSGITVVGLGAGLGVALLLVSVQSTFVSSSRLLTVVGVPVVGSVSLVEDASAHGRRAVRLIAFGLGFVALFATYAGLMLLERNVGLNSLLPDGLTLSSLLPL